MAFFLPALPYTVDALEPHIDSLTMTIHHSKHHQTYINNLNAAINNTPADSLSIEEILKTISSYPDAVRNNGGGHYNHSFFWESLTPKGSLIPLREVDQIIKKSFGSFEEFKKIFTTTAISRFGSGWAWLYINDKGELNICSTANQDNPLMDILPQSSQGTPLLGIDVWEHAYYLKYQNLRAKYIEAFWNIVNWEKVEMRWQRHSKQIKNL